MNISNKVLIGLGTVGSISSGIYAITRQIEQESINKKLIAEGYEILANSSVEWATILISYEATIKNKNKLKFKDFQGENNEKIEQLKQECGKALKENTSEKESYERAKQWCTVPKTLKQLLQKGGYRILSIDTENDEADKGGWDQKLENHVKNNEEFTNKKFTDAHIPKNGVAKKQKENRDAIKKKCQALENKKHYEVDFQTNLEISQLWCAVK